ncbi:MAG: ATP-binding protein [Shewanella sp.]|nr:ATP-binding protein [Shewanella sp.]MCF1430162.1 ATP-binding protein [Shewanella sp.]MCF1437575.1 ATP-binding protein [Shewanella sp.]MCF1456240.1 ATP-binding protein [Shewanella sp.]
MPLISKQRGNFTIEFALLAVVFATLLIFTADMVIKLSMQGKLDRLSYSAVNILKERTQLFDTASTVVDAATAADLFTIVNNSLKRTSDNHQGKLLGATFESLTFADSQASPSLTQVSQGGGCQLAKDLDEFAHLSFMTSWGRRANLYRVTLCYETDNWAGELFDAQFTTVQSSSIMMGR